jgi:probable addiction module antidote protein
MSTIFIGGSRHISRLPAEIKQRLDNIVASRHQVVIGDANGADKAVQKHLLDVGYDKVTIFCSGDTCRNNLGGWRTHHVSAPRNVKGYQFQFYAAKDREMAREADFGLMIWDGKSAGTILNVLRLVRAGKIAVVINVPEKSSLNIKSAAQWDMFLAKCSAKLRSDLRERATPDEWAPASLDTPPKERRSPSADDLAAINVALESGDSASVVDAIGNMARSHGMTHVSRETGLARESLYRSLANGGNPEFVTVLKVLASLGLRLEARPIAPEIIESEPN